MRLSQIKLAGFKSFVDPTTVTLPGSRCAVVGPNGCGKSNIIDAVRWVMGESSAKQLRGESITDVIFNGSTTRKPTAVASIELIFDNADGRIGGEYASYAQISIRRQVSRDAQSAYFLNGSKCRRRDIMDIFLGTGFGPRSYSIIEQGMISQLVEAKPDDLRVYLEEAAGISKYKERRRETENRIKHTKENLERLTDIRDELTRQLDRLQRQAKAAEKYRELKDDERKYTAELHALRYINIAASLETQQQSIRASEVGLEKAISEQRGLDANIEAQRQNHSAASDEFNKVQGRFYQIGAEIARDEEAIAFNQQRLKQLELDLESVSQRSAEAQRQLEMDNAEISGLQSDVANLAPEVEQAQAQDAQAQEALESIEQENKSWQTAWDEFNAQASAVERNAEVQSSRIEHLGELLQRLNGRMAQLASDEAGEPMVASDQVDSLAAQISELEQQRRNQDAEIDSCLKDLANAREDVILREQDLDDARIEVQGLRHDLANLQAVQQAAVGRDPQTIEDAQRWLEDQGLSKSERLGEALAVAPGWERAVERVLGDFLQAVRVNSVEDFTATLQRLDSGEVTLVEARLDTYSEGNLPALASLVRTDDLGMASLLNGVFAADSAQAALAERPNLQVGESIITRDGFWVGPDWVRMLPGSDSDAGIIARAQEIETLNLRVEEAEQTLAGLQNHLVQGRSLVQQLEQHRNDVQASVNQVNDQLAEHKTNHGVVQVQMEEADARRDRVSRERADIESQVASEANLLSEARAALSEAEQEREGFTDRRMELSGNRERSEVTLTEARNAARASRDHFHSVSSRIQEFRSRLVASETARERLVNQQRSLVEQTENLQQGINSSGTPLPELQAKLEEKLANRLTVETELNTQRKKLEEIDTEIRELESQRAAAEEAVNKVRGELEEARVARQGMTVQEQNLREQIGNTGFEVSEICEQLPEEAAEEAWAQELDKIDRRIQRLGAINLAAIDEYDTESERKIYLDKQNEDLEQALETLLGAIKKIDKETRTRFKDTFEKVNTRLGELFPKVFGGGHAYLELTGEDLLDTGVSLMARPPGKRNASVHLLSGGEKAMTAVALIFAIFHLNPSPVCLLDEVDAPLDDSNVMRFAELIKEMSAEVQFVVITHNKITMEMADHLMGVTMGEPGVSRLVSVDVEEAAALAAV